MDPRPPVLDGAPADRPAEPGLPTLAIDYLREVLAAGRSASSEAWTGPANDEPSAPPVLPWGTTEPAENPHEAARRREWSRRWRRLRLADELAEFVRRLSAAATADEVYAIVPEAAARIVGGYTCLLFVPGQGQGLRALPDERLRTRADDLRIPVLRRRMNVSAQEAERAGGRFASLAPLFAEDRAAVLACAPFGRGGALMLVERRRNRVFEDEDWELLSLLAAHGQAALERVRAAERVADLAGIDPVTGLAGRAHVERVLEHAWEVVLHGRPLSVVLLALDGLGGAQARFDPAAADRLVRSTADAVREALPAEAMALRYGPGEFLLVLPGASPAQAAAVVSRVRVRLALPLQLHAGIAGDHEGTRGPRELLRSVRASVPLPAPERA